MADASGEPFQGSKAWQGKRQTQLLAIGLGVLPLYGILIILEILGGPSLSLRSFVVYLAVICPLSLGVALLVLQFICGESPRTLNLRSGGLFADLLGALVLSCVTLAAGVVATSLLSALFPQAASGTSIRELFKGLAGNPGLLALFLGLLMPLGAASEEVIRVFLLSRLWKMWPGAPGKAFAVVLSAGLFGLLHLYHGPVAIVWTALYGLIMALYYLRFGRVLPMILSHYLTNALQVIIAAGLAR